MHSGNDKKGFDAEKWKRENTDPGGGRLLRVKGARYDDHSDTLRKMEEERKRRSEQPGSSMSGSSSSGVGSSNKR